MHGRPLRRSQSPRHRTLTLPRSSVAPIPNALMLMPVLAHRFFPNLLRGRWKGGPKFAIADMAVPDGLLFRSVLRAMDITVFLERAPTSMRKSIRVLFASSHVQKSKVSLLYVYSHLLDQILYSLSLFDLIHVPKLNNTPSIGGMSRRLARQARGASKVCSTTYNNTSPSPSSYAPLSFIRFSRDSRTAREWISSRTPSKCSSTMGKDEALR